MTYTRGIPDGAQSPATQQVPLQTNTNLVDDYFGVDHNAFSSATAQGEHKQITYTAPLTVPPAPAGTKASLYTETIAGQTQLVFKNAASTYQLTPPGLAVFTPIAQARVIRVAGVWSFTVSSGFASVTRNAEGQFSLSFSAPQSPNALRYQVTSSTGNVPGNFGVTGVVSALNMNGISFYFLNADGAYKDPFPSLGFTVLIW